METNLVKIRREIESSTFIKEYDFEYSDKLDPITLFVQFNINAPKYDFGRIEALLQRIKRFMPGGVRLKVELYFTY